MASDLSDLKTCDCSLKSNNADFRYIITTKTSGAFYGGKITDLTLLIDLVGIPTGSDDGSLQATGYTTLEQKVGEHFHMGQLDRFEISTKNVGFPKFIRLMLHDKHEVCWFCDYVKIGIAGRLKEMIYPVYDCVKQEITVLEGTASIPQTISDNHIKLARQAEVKQNKIVYPWVPEATSEDELGWGFPRYVNAKNYDELPPMFKREKERMENFLGTRRKAKDKFGLNPIEGLMVLFKQRFAASEWSSFEQFQNLYKQKELPMDNPCYLANWKTDATMGRQVLTGISPLAIDPCPSLDSLPDYFNVTNDDLIGVLEQGKTMEDEMEAGKMFIVDYKPLIDGIEENAGMYCPKSIGLFYIKNDEFVPIAIQLVPKDRDYLFTPKDSPEAWLQAKMYFRTSMSGIHEWINHLLHTHIVMEPFAVALFRCFPECHPVYKLLRPHLQTVSAINTDGREILIKPGSKANEALALSGTSTMRKFFSKFQFDDLVIPKVLAKKGLDKPEKDKLPGYYYRDDSMALWKIMENFVTNVIGYYYKTDEDVIADYELQDWMHDVDTNGFNWQEIVANRVPEVKTVKQLIEVCVTLMFTCSAQHAAVNFGQFETYKFIPNSPACMRKPPQKRTETITEKSILERLPDHNQAILAIAITFLLSSYSPDDVFIGQFPEKFFTDENIIKMQLDYNKALEEFEEKLVTRNIKLPKESQYTFLIPGRVPRNIAI